MNTNVSKIVDEWSYRLSLIEGHDGLPDIESYSDLTVLKSVLSDHKWPVEITYELLYNMEHPLLKEAAGNPAWRDMIHGGVAKKYNKIGKQSNNWSWVVEDVEDEKFLKGVIEYIKTTWPDDVLEAKLIQGTSKGGTLPSPMENHNGESGTFPMIVVKRKESKEWNAFKVTRGGAAKGKSGSVKGQDYEMGIVVEMNKRNNPSYDDKAACDKGDVPWKDYQRFLGNAKYLKTCYDIAHSSKLKKENMKWFGTGQAKKNYYSNLGINASNKTPKTDLYGSTFISLKKDGGSQLMSGTADDAKGVLLAAQAFTQKHNPKVFNQTVQKMISDIETNFARNVKTPHTINSIREKLQEAWIPHRADELKAMTTVKKGYKNKKGKKTDFSQTKLDRHAQAEGILLQIFKSAGKWEYVDKNNPGWFLVDEKGNEVVKGTDKLTMNKFQTWFDGWLKGQSEAIKKEMEFFVDQVVKHKDMEDALQKGIFQSPEFKKWCVYEAATGNYKYTGTDALAHVADAQADRLLKFDDAGIKEWAPDLEKYAEKNKNSVTATIGFKTSKSSKSSSLRMALQEEKQFIEGSPTKFQNEVSNIIDDELVFFYEQLDNGLDFYSELLEEGLKDMWKKTKANLKKAAKKVQAIAKKFWKWLTKLIEGLYNNVIKKTMDQLKIWGKEGAMILASNLGVTPLKTNKVEINLP